MHACIKILNYPEKACIICRFYQKKKKIIISKLLLLTSDALENSSQWPWKES